MFAEIGPKATNRLLIGVAGLGGLLYGIDIGIISAALLYVAKTISLSLAQTSLIVAAVLGGSMVSSLGAGLLADLIGRKKAMILSGLLFVSSIGLIVVAHDFPVLLIGRLLQGASGGVIAVVIPLYLAECLSPEKRGQGTAIFQLTLTFGIVVASITGWIFTERAEHAISAAAGNLLQIHAAQDSAWRGMFLSMIIPGLIFVVGTFALIESPRWLFSKGRKTDALASLQAFAAPDAARLQFEEMEAIARRETGTSDARGTHANRDRLLQRKYVLPFALACVVLACNQATGVNSILGFLVVMLKHAGMSAQLATQSDVVVKVLHCLVVIVAVALIERKGRLFLLRIGTGGVLCSLIASAALFYSFESHSLDIKSSLIDKIDTNKLVFKDMSEVQQIPGIPQITGPRILTVLYSYGDGDRVVAFSSSDREPLQILPQGSSASARLEIKRAYYGPAASPAMGWMIAICLAAFVSFFSVGPGVVVWLALSELMPTRIRSTGMGIALVINQGVSTLIAALFLPVVGRMGYYAMFAFWAACTTIYCMTAWFFLPETKGKTLEEIEANFVSHVAPKTSLGPS
jgi:SP family myo-inositol transporter-like MFS transporter 13